MTDQSFPKLNRLLSRGDFQDLKPGSRRLVSGRLVFFFKFKDLQETSRLGISVSKKIGNAVKRNRIKRLIRESFRQGRYKNSSIDFLVTVSTRNFNKKNKESFLDLELSVVDDFEAGLEKIFK